MRLNFNLVMVAWFVCICNCKTQIITEKNENFLGISENEEIAIEKVKELAGKWLYLDYMKTNLYLIRWVRDAGSNPEKATKKIIAFHKVRKENHIDGILSENWDGLDKKFPFELLDGVDNEGAPIITISIGAWDLRKGVVGGKINKIYRYIDYMLEKCYEHIRRANRINGTVIINMAGFSSRTHLCAHCILLYPYMANAFENHYPQTIKHLSMINTPSYFRPAVEGIKLAISGHTLSALRIFDFDKTEWGPPILEAISAEVLKPEFGGTRKN